MSLEGDIFAAIQDAAKSDAGSGGLGEAGGVAEVLQNDFYRADDPDDRGASRYPLVRVACDTHEEQDAFGAGRAVALVRISVVTRRNTDSFDTLDAVTKRMRTLFHRSTLTATTDWNFSTITLRRVFRGPSSDTEMQRVLEFSLVASRTSGVA